MWRPYRDEDHADTCTNIPRSRIRTPTRRMRDPGALERPGRHGPEFFRHVRTLRSSTNFRHSQAACSLLVLGSTTTGAGDPPDSIREAILGRMLAGQSLGESVHTSVSESGHRSSHSSVYYAIVEPFRGLVDICGQGIEVSALHITGGVARLLTADSPWQTSSPLRDGDSLLLVAHPGRWSRYVLGAVDRTLVDRKDHLGERDALNLCGQMRNLLPGDSASVLLHCNESAQTAVSMLREGE